MIVKGYYIGLGDKTECGGQVLEGDNSISWDGLVHSLEGHQVSCGKNGKSYQINGGVSSFTTDGRRVAGSLDSISGCPCQSRLIPSVFTATYTKEISASPQASRANAQVDNQAAAQAEDHVAAKPPITETTPLALPDKAATFGRSFSIIHSETRHPLAFRTFIATVDQRETVGVTDADGLAHIPAPTADSAITIHIPFQSPARVLHELTTQPMPGNPFKTSGQALKLTPGQQLKPITITVNDRAGTREALIRQVRLLGHEFVERSEWKAHVPKKPMKDDWNYSMIALHHAGRSYSCGTGAEQMLDTQEDQQDESRSEPFDDIGYHFGIDCSGAIYEGRDIRFLGSSVKLYNTNVIGVVLLNNLTTPEEGNDWVAVTRKTLRSFGIDTTNKIPALQIDAALNLITVLKNIFTIKHFGGHREFPGQTKGEGRICPGSVGMNLVKNIRIKTQLMKPPRS